MKHLRINETKNSPLVELSTEGEMIIQGRSILDDPIAFYNPIIDWISNYKTSTFTLEMRLEYMNTSSSKMILNLLKAIKENYNTSNIFIKWFYESDDEDILDIGKDYESIIRIPIDFYELHVEDTI